MGAGDGRHHPPVIATLSIRSFECTLATTTSISAEQLVLLVEAAVVEDVDLDAGEDAERRQLVVELGHHVELPPGSASSRACEARRMVGEREVLMAERARLAISGWGCRRRTSSNACGSRP